MALGDRLAPGVEDYLDLLTDTTPYAPAGETRRVASRTDLAAFVESLRGYVVLADVQLRARYRSDGDVTRHHPGAPAVGAGVVPRPAFLERARARRTSRRVGAAATLR